MARNPDFLALTPLDHIVAKIHLPYILHFNTTGSKVALNIIENGINKLVAHIPWLAGDVIMRSEPDGPRNKGYIAFSSSLPEATPMLRVKCLGRDKIMTRVRPESSSLCHASYQRRSNVRSSDSKQMSSRAGLFWLCPSRTLRLMAPVLGQFWKLSRSAAKRRMMVQM